jgi:hypothetical protein
MPDHQATVPTRRSYTQTVADITRGLKLLVNRQAIVIANGIALEANPKASIRIIQNLSAIACAWKIKDGGTTDIDLNNESYLVMAANTVANAGNGGEVNLSWCTGRIIVKDMAGGAARVSVLEAQYPNG